MIKAYQKSKSSAKLMRRTSRIYLSYLNHQKCVTLSNFLVKCHVITQYFIDFFWQKRDFSASLADSSVIHHAQERFPYAYRLIQALAKQAKEAVRSQIKVKQRKPRLRHHSVVLYSHFVKIEKFVNDGHFDYVVKLGGSDVPKVIVPFGSTHHLNQKLENGWILGKSVRLGIDAHHRLYLDLFLEKSAPTARLSGRVVGMDNNYKAGLVFSDGQIVGGDNYAKIQKFTKRQKNTYTQSKELIFNSLNKNLDLSNIKALSVENLKNVKQNTRGKFPRSLNRRLSHWLYASILKRLEQHCEENGIRLLKKSPWKTSQRCSACGKWDRRNRKGDKFECLHCSFLCNADYNAALNLEFLGLAGIYGLRSLEESKTTTKVA